MKSWVIDLGSGVSVWLAIFALLMGEPGLAIAFGVCVVGFIVAAMLRDRAHKRDDDQDRSL
jgi:hypothetical protein